MLIKNVKVFTEEKEFIDGEILIRDGEFSGIRLNNGTNQEIFEEQEWIDGEGAYAIPGLVDIHFHGCKGYDFCDGMKEAIEEIAKYEAAVGVTAIAPATMTLPVEELEKILKVAAEYKKEKHEGADLIGINMEGPFISPVKKGAQDAKNIIACDTEICQKFLDASEGLVKLVAVAPEECKETSSFIKQMKDKVDISLAHTNADYDSADEAFKAGAKHAVHLYNGMSAYTHRSPGVVGAVADHTHVTAEIICDGVHVHPSVVRATFKMLGEERIILISDSMRATGMPDGHYTLGGLEVEVVDNRATLVSNGALAGSTTNLMECLKVAVKEMGIPLETAVACATMNPAKTIGEYGNYGSITVGKKANVVLLDQELNVKMVVKDGAAIPVYF
ncbi:MAG: N-acetylglucosamine-6-phosphate deacetylase [Dorea sp.]